MLINITLQFFNEIMHCMTLCSFFIFAFLKNKKNAHEWKTNYEKCKRFNTVYMYSLKGNPRYGLDLIPSRAFQTGKLPKRFCEILQNKTF